MPTQSKLPTFPLVAWIETDQFLQPNHSEEEMQINFTSGEAARCLDSIVSHQDLQSARHRIQQNRDTGRMRQELVQGIIKLSAGNLFLAGLCEVGTEVQDRMKNVAEKATQQEQQQYEKARSTYIDLFCKANSIRSEKSNWKQWSNKELTAVLNTMKRKTDRPLPKKKADLVALYEEWNLIRSPFSFREYCEMHNKVIPEGQASELDLFFEESDNDSEFENVETQVANSLLELTRPSQSN